MWRCLSTEIAGRVCGSNLAKDIMKAGFRLTNPRVQLEDRYMWEIPSPSTQWLDPAGDRQVAGLLIGSMFGSPFIRCQLDVWANPSCNICSIPVLGDSPGTGVTALGQCPTFTYIYFGVCPNPATVGIRIRYVFFSEGIPILRHQILKRVFVTREAGCKHSWG